MKVQSRKVAEFFFVYLLRLGVNQGKHDSALLPPSPLPLFHPELVFTEKKYFLKFLGLLAFPHFPKQSSKTKQILSPQKRKSLRFHATLCTYQFRQSQYSIS
jgi:hypothetical protein